MAIYSLRLTPIGKTTQKRPFTAAAHVRYIARPGAATHVMAERMPENKGRAQRWLRSAEKADRKNARVADKLVIALPIELTLDQNIGLVRTFAETLTRGRASWFAAIHARGKDRENPHVHILVRDRDVQTGERVVMFSAGPKEVQQRAAKGKTAPTTLNLIRELWEKSANAALAEAGRRERIDRRRLSAQGIARPAQVHEGPNIRAMHQRGFRPRSTDRVYRNRPGRRGRARERTVRYGEIDRGITRVEYNNALRQEARGGAATLRVVQAVPLAATKQLVQAAARTESSASPVAAMPELVERRAESRNDAEHGNTLIELSSLVTGDPSSYGPSMATSPEQANPATALSLRFAEGRATLVEALRGSFQEPEDVADTLLSHADEFGPKHAAERFLAAPETFGARVAGANLPLAVEDLASALESLVDGHDELDRETRRHDGAHDRVGKTGQTIHVQGEAFTLDAEKRSLVSRDGKTALPLEALDRDVSFMERLIDEQGPREEPVRSGRDRETPGRGR